MQNFYCSRQEILEERIEGKRKLIKKVEYQVTLVTRGSVGKIE